MDNSAPILNNWWSGKIRNLSALLKKLNSERDFQAFVTKESNRVPAFMIDTVKKDLGPLWQWLPNKSLSYDTNILSKPQLTKT